jgi:hypothetical protein
MTSQAGSPEDLQRILDTLTDEERAVFDLALPRARAHLHVLDVPGASLKTGAREISISAIVPMPGASLQLGAAELVASATFDVTVDAEYVGPPTAVERAAADAIRHVGRTLASPKVQVALAMALVTSLAPDNTTVNVHIGTVFGDHHSAEPAAAREPAFRSYSPLARVIYDVLRERGAPASADDLAAETKIPRPDVATALQELHREGAVDELAFGAYTPAKR